MKEKFKAFGLPLAVISVLIGIVFFQQLHTLTELPDENWSRSIPFEMETEEKPIVFQKENEVFYSEEDKVHHFSVNDGLEVKNEGDISFTVPRGYSFWTDGEQFVTLSQGVLKVSGVSEKIIAEEVSGVATQEDKIIFWQESNVFNLDLETWEPIALHSFTNEVANVFFGSDGGYVIAQQTDDVNADLFYVTADDTVNANPFMKVANNKNNKLGNLAYTVQNGEITFLYDTQMRSQGVLSYSMYMAKAPLSELGSNSLKPETVEIINEANGAKLETPRYVQFMKSTENPTLLFTAEAQGVGAGNAVALYTGTYDGSSTIRSSSITTTDGISHFPVDGFGDSIVWLDYKGGSYSLYGASQSPEVMAASTDLSSRSWKEAGINTVLMLGSSMVTILVSFYWVLPSLLLLIVLYMTKPNIFEKEEINWVEYVSIAIFAAMPFTFIDKAMNGYFYEIAPSYLTFTGSSWILLLIITAVSAGVWKLGRDPEWGTFGGAFYFIGVYIMLYVTSIGTYVFNLF
ncbi:hypothetical protein FZC84_02690 [Rossellomorea vietnamensis]|uniref:Uncharacterized protein n=1 Tax=Rossellomorea vietnamensis TaxID=218284 RepID=A0A5D4MIK4_9BACI|nr:MULTISPECIES: hypothetical protein [Bacillaceae]TYS01573.1 hypothetical protein FZC84_02690 [Rossellomorea vietnamensis]